MNTFIKLIIALSLFFIFSCQQSAVKKTVLNTKKFESKNQEIKMDTKPVDIQYDSPDATLQNTPAVPLVKKNPPNFGLIFSAGGAKTWAHLGVLKEMQKYKFPIVSVVGIEWGSAIAAVYAQNLSSNEAEWEMSKFKSTDKSQEFIKSAFEKKTVAGMKAGFACPSINIKSQKAYILNRGNVDQFLQFCLPSPGLTKPYGQSVALMSDISALVQHLRSTGVQKIILIDVLAHQSSKPFYGNVESYENQIWVTAATQMAKAATTVGIDEVIKIDVSNFPIDNFDERREVMAKGSELGYSQIKKIAEKYGL
jgi:hypothetical protein